MRRLAVLGPPSSDRSHVADLIATRLGGPAVRVRDAVQAEVRAGTPVAAEWNRCMRSGQPVPQELVSVDATLPPEQIVAAATC